MAVPEFVDIDPGTLRLPPTRSAGADPAKLARQFSRFGLSVNGMPSPWVSRDGGGLLAILDGVTRATRVAKYLPGRLIRVEVTEEHLATSYANYPMLRDRLP